MTGVGRGEGACFFVVVVGFIILFVLLLLSAAFSAVETAFTSLSEVKLEQLRSQGGQRGKIVVEICESESAFKKLLTLVLLGNNLANIGAASLLTMLTIELFGVTWVAIASAALTVVVLIFAEVTPKQIAVSYNVKICLMAAQTLRFLQWALGPFIRALFWVTSRLVGRLAANLDPQDRGAEDLFHMVNLSAARGLVAPYERIMLHNVLRFSRLCGRQVMTHRMDIFSLNEDCTLAEALQEERLRDYRVVLVYRGDPEHIVGMVDSQEVLLLFHQEGGQIPLKKIVRAVICVPDGLHVPQLWLLMQHHQAGLVVLIDEYGGLAGLVSRQDIIGAVFSSLGEGETGRGIIQQHDGWKLEGSLPLSSLENYFNLPLHSSKRRSATVGGYLLDRVGHMPEVGQVIEQPEGRYRIMELRRNSIAWVHFCPGHAPSVETQRSNSLL